MKKFLTVLLACLVAVVGLFTFTACNDDGDNGDGGNNTQKLYVYTNAGFPPYEYIDSKGNVVGVDVELMKEIGNVLGYEVVINDIEFNQILDEVTKNKFAVGAAGMTKNDERDAICTSSIPYTTSVQYVIAPKDSLDAYVVGGKVPMSALANLNKKSIGVQAGTTGSFLVGDAIDGIDEEDGSHTVGDLEGKDCQMQEYTNAIVASNDIGTAIGAVVIDKLPAESIVSANSNLECYQLDAEPESYVLYFNKEATELVAKVNKVLEAMIENGVINYYTLKHSGNLA